MAVDPPPYALAWQVERYVPGLYGAFWSRLVSGATRETRATSWFRTSTRNEQVGGQPDSQHLLGLAIDLWEPDLDDLAARMRATGLVTVRYGGHVHVQAWPAGTARRRGWFRI